MAAVTPGDARDAFKLDVTLLALEASVTPVAGIEDLVSSARGAFQLVEPWFHATPSSDNSHVKGVIVEVKHQATIYLNAVDMSIQISKDGERFAEDAMALCEFLGRDTPSDSLLSFIDDLTKLATNTHRNAQTMVDLFRSSRRGLFQVANNITRNVTELGQEARCAERSEKRFLGLAFVAGSIARTADHAGTYTGLISSAFPLANIILPIVLPLISLTAHQIEERCAAKAQARAMRVISCTDAQPQLQNINQDMIALLDHVTTFVNWWSNVVTSLVLIKTIVARLGSSGLDQRRVVMLTERWAAVKNQYQSYGSEIIKLQDFYPDLPRENLSLISVIFPQRAPNLADQRRQQINLVYTVSSLADHMDICRLAFDKLQNASTNLNKQKGALFREKLDDMKVHLKLECEKLLTYLEEILAFSGKARTPPFDGDTESTENYHDTTWTAAVELLEMTQGIATLHRSSQNSFSSHKGAIVKLLSSNNGNKSASSEDKGASYRPTSFDDVQASLSNLEMALLDIQLSLDNLLNFWHSRLATLRATGRIPGGGVDEETTSLQDPLYATIISAVRSITLLFDTLVVLEVSAKVHGKLFHRPWK